MTKHVNNAYVLNRVNSVKKTNEHANNKVSIQGSQGNFKDVLDRIGKEDGITITKHAQIRLNTRGLELKESELKQVSKAMDDAEKKGVKDAVIVMGERLLIASVTNRTIITAAQKNDIKEKIVTKIDGAIFI